MLVLAIDTSAVASAALVDQSGVLASRSVFDPRRHVEVLAPAVREILAEAGMPEASGLSSRIGAVVVGSGPGPYTGLRVGIASALGYGLGWGVPVYGVGSLDALALQLQRAGLLGEDAIVATDARRREVYWARYRGSDELGLPARIEGPGVETPAELAARHPGVPVAGRGAQLYPEQLGAPPSESPELLEPLAGAIGEIAVRRLAAGMDLPEPRPEYLRRPDAVRPGARKRVLG